MNNLINASTNFSKKHGLECLCLSLVTMGSLFVCVVILVAISAMDNFLMQLGLSVGLLVALVGSIAFFISSVASAEYFHKGTDDYHLSKIYDVRVRSIAAGFVAEVSVIFIVIIAVAFL